METLKLQQGETTDITIELSEPLQSDDILYYAISKGKKVLLSGNSMDGGITKVDDTHYVVNLRSEETSQLSQCSLELAYGKEGRLMVNIGEESIPLEFTYNSIQNTLL